jgi:serine/threonine protein kinase
MLTSKPPFQSSTTDEIYRRAKDRDYEWPTSETQQKYISQEAKDLVATMLQEADRRPDPDTIVSHPFFTSGYMPVASDINYKLRELAPDSSAFYEPLNSLAASVNLRNVQEMCRGCGVGPWCQSQLVFRNIWREMAEEEQNGLTPVIPLAEGIVYRPFDEIKSEQKLQVRLAAQQMAKPSSQASERTDESRGLKESTQPQKVASLLRVPPQSFAAQQRAQHRPSSTPAATGIVRSKTVTEPATRTVSLRPRVSREMPPPPQPSSEEAPPVSRTATRSLRSQITSARSQPTVGSEDKAPAPRRSASTREKRQEEKLSLFSPSEYQEEVPGTQPDVVLERLRKLQTELERALNARTMALVSSRDKTPAPPSIVVKWVDYTNKFGLGYVLNDGSVGCILRSISAPEGSNPGMLPPACLLVHDAERHCLRKDDPNYGARHQIVPMKEGIYFYENNGETGISRVRVAPESFVLPVGPDGTIGKLSAGKDIYDHRKRERIVLWKKFANYMIAYGREMENQPDDTAMRPPSITDPAAVPTDVVTFYQRFGDVGCWMFSDGHMQFNFPDHTKIVLDASGTWCHFWHLPQAAAEALEETGSLAESALDDRAVLSYPLQTLLNFSKPSAPNSRSSSTSSAPASRSASLSSARRRPEISPDLQGIPAANQFRKKIEFVRDVVREWTANDGLGNSDLSREGRLRWCGVRETRGVQIPSKHVWVTIGARQGDERLASMVDPRRPWVRGEDIDERRR